MKKALITITAATMVLTFVSAANAVTAKHSVSADVRAACKQEAAKKYSSINVIYRRHYASKCMAQHARAAKARHAARLATRPAPTANPNTSGQAPKQ